jgi:hypothetical protein
MSDFDLESLRASMLVLPGFIAFQCLGFSRWRSDLAVAVLGWSFQTLLSIVSNQLFPTRKTTGVADRWAVY